MIKKILKVECCLLSVVLVITAFVIYKDYKSRPGLITEDTLQVGKRTTDAVNLEWKPVRNTDTYIVSYKPKTSTEWKEVKVSGDKNEVEVNDLKEGVEYDFSLRADSAERKGLKTDSTSSSTKKHQSIEGKTKQMKLASSDIDLNLSSETEIKIEPHDETEAVVNEDQTLEVTNPGTIKLTAKAEENEEFVEDEVEVEVEVLDSVYEKTSDASIHTMYRLDETNCELKKTITGSGSAIVPQSFGYTGDKYIVAYGMHDSQKIVSFDVDGDGKDVSNPQVKLGHPNGFDYSDATKNCYCVKGWGGRCVVYTPETNGYDIIELPYGASGIAYDRLAKEFYTSSRNLMVAYSENFETVKTVPAVRHKGTYYTQDCGGYSGIMMRCLSDKSKHGTNLIDLYDMINGKYLGTIECDLSEVESAIVNNEGYMELLCNTTDEKDYIWKTPINIEDLGAEILQAKEEVNHE